LERLSRFGEIDRLWNTRAGGFQSSGGLRHHFVAASGASHPAKLRAPTDRCGRPGDRQDVDVLQLGDSSPDEPFIVSSLVHTACDSLAISAVRQHWPRA
jgi:hypothetical protein